MFWKAKFFLHTYKESRPKDLDISPPPATLVCMWDFYMEPEKHRRQFLHVTLLKFAPKSNQDTDWPHLHFILSYI
jgi:hypothetical protein